MEERYTIPNKKILKELVDLDEKAELRKENKELKNQLMLTENDRDEREVKARDMMKENKELKEHKENLIRADKKKTEHIEELEKENKELKEQLAECENDKIKWELEAKGYKKTLDGISFSL